MLKVVLDTNVIISAALSPKGKPAETFKIITSNNDIELSYNEIIFAEYKRVFSYERLNIPSEKQKEFLEAIKDEGIVREPITSDILLPDESDRIFYDTAKTVNAYLITGNIKHYPSENFILTPAQFLDLLSL